MSEFDANVVAMLTRHRAVGYFHAAHAPLKFSTYAEHLKHGAARSGAVVQSLLM